MGAKQEWNFNKRLLIHGEHQRGLSEYKLKKASSSGMQVVTNH